MPAEPDLRHAMVDRIVEGLAVLLVAGDEAEHHVPAAALPAGAGEGTWLLVRGAGADLTLVGVDTEGERAARRDVEERVARLRRTRGGGRFGDG
ncbi:MAG TPA: DUF3006 family protein [Egibacteraceae bacterium]|jgi:hypothetical protein|nr:DUF3006 family protein [Egibacteraceae bacterium]